MSRPIKKRLVVGFIGAALLGVGFCVGLVGAFQLWEVGCVVFGTQLFVYALFTS